MLRAVCSCVLLLLVAPGASGKAGDLFHETFDTMEAWVQSKAKAYDGVAKLEENGLVLPDEARRYGVSAPLKTPWTPGKDLVVQYELRFTENSLECGGAYLKVREHPEALEPFPPPEMTINVDFPMISAR